MSLNLWDTLSSSVGIYSDGQGALNVWNDSQHRWRWELYNVASQWVCAVPGDPCTSSGTWTSATWGYTIGQSEWRNFVNGVLADSGQNPYSFSWGPNTNGGGWGSSGDSVPEPGTGSTFFVGGLGMIVMARAGKMRRWYARLIRARH